MDFALLLFLVLSGAFGAEQGPPPPPSPAAEGPAPDARDQYTLVREIVAAQLADDAPSALARVKGAWEGRRYRWEMRHLPVLCRSAGACYAAPFDHGRGEEPIVQGWLPRLGLDEAEHAELVRACAPYEQCIVTLEGRLDELVLSVVRPTSLSFTDVDVVSARGERDDEQFLRHGY
jgi:hypothetical protein